MRTYENFDLLVDGTPGSYRARVIGSPAGEASAEFVLRLSEQERQTALWLLGRTRDLGVAQKDPDTTDRGSLRELGQRLFEAAFAGKVGGQLRRSLDLAQGRGAGLRIRLRLDENVPELADLPWEFLFAPDLDRFLALSDLTPIVRYIERAEPVQPLRVTPPLNLLAILSSPSDLPPLAVEQEWQRLQYALAGLQAGRLIALERLEAATLSALQARLRRGSVHMLHFIGHGFFDPGSNCGGLVFEDQAGRQEIVPAEMLGMLLHDHTPLRLTFLNACEGARGGRSDPFAGVAQRLVQQGVPAVLAMQFPISDAAAIALSQEFYHALADGYPCDAALSEARKAIVALGNSYEWGTPVLFSRSNDNRLIELDQGDSLAATGQSSAMKITPPPEPVRPPHAAGFVGRQAELADYAHKLATQHLVVIAGMPGIGKTALAARLAQQVAASPDRIFWHQFHEGEGIATIIWRLAGMLWRHGQPALWELLEGARQSGGQPPPAEVLLDYLVQLLRGQDYVLCLDDFHHAEEDSLVEKAVDRLQALLSAGEISLIVTTRRVPDVVTTPDLAPLAGLSLFDARTLLIARGVHLPDDLLAALHRGTEGNAELLTLAAQALRHARHPEQVVARLAEEQDIETFLLIEVDEQLKHDEKAVMSGVAALLGYPGTRGAIEAALASGSLKRTVRYLANRFLLLEQEGALDREYLQHAIIQAFYYDLLGRRERQALHRRAGEHYEHEEPDPLRAAMHYQAGGEHDRAARLATADIWACINRGQVRLLRTLLTSLGQQALEVQWSVAVQLALGEVLAFLGEVQPAQAAYQAALSALQGRAASPELGDSEARTCLGMASLLANQAPDEALRWLDRGQTTVSQGNLLLQAALHNRRGTLLVGQAEYQEAIAALQRALSLLPDTPGQLRASVLNNLGVAYGWAGDTPRGSLYAAQALEISRALHDTYSVLSIVSNIGVDKEVAGDWVGAASDYQEALALAEQMGSRTGQARIHNLLGTLRLHQCDDAAAEGHLVRAVAIFRQVNNPEYVAATLPILAQLHLRRQEWAPARIALAESEALAAAQGWDYILPETYSTQAQLALATDDLADAQERAAQAIAIAAELGQSMDEGKAWRAKGLALAAAGQMDEALAAFEGSLALLTEQDPYETALTQLAFAQALAAASDDERSADLRSQAIATLQILGVVVEPRLASLMPFKRGELP